MRKYYIIILSALLAFSCDNNKIKISKNETKVLDKKNTFIYSIMTSLRQKINDPLGKRKAK